MQSNDFEQKCKEELVKELKEKYNEDYSKDEVHLVWFSKTLQNFKCILVVFKYDYKVCECTYNGDKKQLYVDIYEKKYNKLIDNVE